MKSTAFRLLDLPLEIFQLVLAEAIRVRRLKRAFRLRLVNRFFAVQVIETLSGFRMLDDCDLEVNEMGAVGAEYIARRFRKNLPLSPGWTSLRGIAAELALADHGDVYDACLEDLIRLAAKRYAFPMAAACLFPTEREEDYRADHYSLDLCAAAAYFNKLSIVEQKIVGDQLSDCGLMFGSVFTMAAKGGHEGMVELLLRKLPLPSPDVSSFRVVWMLTILSRYSSPRMVELFLTNIVRLPAHSNSLRWSLRTSNVETFTIIREFYMAHPSLQKSFTVHAGTCLHKAARAGWKDMVAHLLSIGMLVEGSRRVAVTQGGPLTIACRSGYQDIARTLLQHGARLYGDEVGESAKYGRWAIVWMLVDEYNADVDGGDPPALVSAVAYEREDVVLELKKKGAALAGKAGEMALARATAEGLESMVLLLNEHGVH